MEEKLLTDSNGHKKGVGIIAFILLLFLIPSIVMNVVYMKKTADAEDKIALLQKELEQMTEAIYENSLEVEPTVIPTLGTSEEPSDTPTETSTNTPALTTSYKTITIKIPSYDSSDGSGGVQAVIEIPKEVTTEKVKVGAGYAYILKKGSKTYMMFHLPYELYEKKGYTSATTVASNTLSNLKRVRSKEVYYSSGSYKFAVTYVLSSSLRSGSQCTSTEFIGDVTTSPCVYPSLNYSSTGSISVYCSIDSTYQALCDRTMKTVKFSKYDDSK